eukprot:XP_019924425.1 PREDICTED: uncharacterized protein LOC105332147 [Crassostrea gigas]
MVKMASVCLVPWVSTTMAPSNGVLIALLEVTVIKRGQVYASYVLLVLIKLNQAASPVLNAVWGRTRITQDRQGVNSVRWGCTKQTRDRAAVYLVTLGHINITVGALCVISAG